MKSPVALLSGILSLLWLVGFCPVSLLAQDEEGPSASQVVEDDLGHYEKMVQSNPQDADAWYNLGNRYIKAGRVQESIQAYRKAIGVKEDHADSWRNLGLVLARTGEMGEALSSLNRAVKIKPGDPSAWFSLGTVQEKVRQFQKAAEAYEKAIAADPNHADACFNLAILELQFGKGAAAALQGRAYLNLKGWKDAGALYMVLVCYYGQRQANEDAAAKDLLAEAVQKCDPAGWPFPIVRFLNGEIGDEDLLKSADRKDKLTEARTYIGLSAMLDGQKDAAVEHFRWVQKEGDKSLFEHRFAMARLRELENAAPSAWDYRKLKKH